jgi:two-component system CheB/CheR fusion protein
MMPEEKGKQKKTAKQARDKKSTKTRAAKPAADQPTHIVGIGASAGGLEAFEQFFSQMPADSGMAFVLVPHLDPTHKSIMAELLRKYTPMEVFQVEDGMTVKQNQVYVIPPDRNMGILQNNFQLLEPTERRGLRHPIDFFFRSLAQDQGDKAICIVLSGTGTEGALGLKAVKGEGGLVIVQDPSNASSSWPMSGRSTRSRSSPPRNGPLRTACRRSSC